MGVTSDLRNEGMKCLLAHKDFLLVFRFERKKSFSSTFPCFLLLQFFPLTLLVSSLRNIWSHDSDEKRCFFPFVGLMKFINNKVDYTINAKTISFLDFSSPFFFTHGKILEKYEEICSLIIIFYFTFFWWWKNIIFHIYNNKKIFWSGEKIVIVFQWWWWRQQLSWVESDDNNFFRKWTKWMNWKFFITNFLLEGL